MNDEFESAVVRTLSEMAKVDAATLAETRATTAVLPGRGSSRRSRFGVRPPQLAVRRSPAFSMAAVVALLVTIVAVSLFGRMQVGPAAPALATPTVESGSPAPTPGSGCAAAASPTWNASALPETLPVTASYLSLSMLGWSPDGSSFALIERANRMSPTETPWGTVDLFSRTGADEGTIQAWGFAWLDATDFAIFRADAPTDGNYVGHAFLGRIGSADLTALPGTYEGLVPGPSGAAALILPWDGTLASPPRYVVIANRALSAPRDGRPAAWSRDGKTLAVFHPTMIGAPPDGAGGVGTVTAWLEVVRATGESVAAARAVEASVWESATFSPDGARVAFYDTGGMRLAVLDLASGNVATVPTVGQLTWAGNDELVIAEVGSSGADSQILSWSATSGQLTPYGTGTFVSASGRGLVIAGESCATQVTVTKRLNGEVGIVGTLDLGALPANGIPDSSWAPDGRSLVVILSEANRGYAVGGNLVYQHAALISF